MNISAEIRIGIDVDYHHFIQKFCRKLALANAELRFAENQATKVEAIVLLSP